MGYTAPTSRTTGDTITAAIWNADVVNNALWLGKDKPQVLTVETTNQAIANATATALTYDDADTFDTQAQHSVSSNTSRITCGTGNTGLYHFTANGRFAANATGYRQVSLRLNGTTEVYRITNPAPSGTNPWEWTIGGYWRFTATTDYMEVVVYQTSTVSLNIENASLTGRFGAVWIASV